MSDELFPPSQIVIPYDDYHGKYVGKIRNGDQFFITTPFTSETFEEKSREYVVLYMFDAAGGLKRFVIDELDSRADLVGEDLAKLLLGNLVKNYESAQAIIDMHIKELGEISYEDITVRLFSFKKDGVEFGLVPGVDDDGQEENQVPYIILQPGNYMVFKEPWDGEYDT